MLGTVPPFPLARREVASHMERCLGAGDVARLAALAIDAISIVSRLSRIEAKAMELSEKAEKGGDYPTAIRGLAETRNTVEILAKIAASGRAPMQSVEQRADDLDDALRAAMAKRDLLPTKELPRPHSDDDITDAEVLVTDS